MSKRIIITEVLPCDDNNKNYKFLNVFTGTFELSLIYKISAFLCINMVEVAPTIKYYHTLQHCRYVTLYSVHV